MITEFEHMGTWWFPYEPNKLFPGKLKYRSDEGATLELYGYFENIKDFKEWTKPNIILGIDSSAQRITLIDCKETKKNISLTSPFPITSSFSINIVIIGEHLKTFDDLRFNRISVSYTNLDEWVNISGFKFEETDEELIIKYKTPKTIKIAIKGGWDISFGLKVLGPTHSIVQKEARIEQRIILTIKPETTRLFEEFKEIIEIIQNLISFAIMEPVFPLTIEGSIKNTDIKIFYKFSDVYVKYKIIYPHEMLFNFSDISERIEDVFNNWFEKVNLIKVSHDLYFGTMYNPKMYPHHKLLSIVQAIESYHREIFQNWEVPLDDHKKRILEILDAIPKYKDWLEEKLVYSNEPSLRKRLKQLISKYSKVVGKYIQNDKKFINDIISTRNDLIHPDSMHKQRALKGKELYNITKYAKFLLEILFLNNIGFSIDEIDKLITRNKKYNLILSN